MDINSTDPNISFDVNPAQNECNVTIDVNSTTQTGQIDWVVQATDPIEHNGSAWQVDDYLNSNGETLSSGIRIVVDGNFTQYLDSNYSSIAKIANLASVPAGNYNLTYKAFDRFENPSNLLTQNISIIDKQPPFLTFIDLAEANRHANGKRRTLTTESNTTINDVIDISSDDLNITYINDSNASISWKSGIAFNLSNHSLIIRDNKDGPVNSALISYHEENGGSYDLLYQESINPNDYNGTLTIEENGSKDYMVEVFTSDLSANDLNFSLHLDYQPAESFSITVIDGYIDGAEIIFDADGDGAFRFIQNFLF